MSVILAISEKRQENIKFGANFSTLMIPSLEIKNIKMVGKYLIGKHPKVQYY